MGEEIENYFKVKKCSERHSCKEFGSRSRFSTAKIWDNVKNRQSSAFLELTSRKTRLDE